MIYAVIDDGGRGIGALYTSFHSYDELLQWTWRNPNYAQRYTLYELKPGRDAKQLFIDDSIDWDDT